MLSHDDNETLVRVGPGTKMGKVMRRYWHPIATSAQLPRPDCDPLRARLLGENFVVFRDSSGKVGVLNELCCHRGASLAIGRVEEGGIRCIYHGWKFAADGTLLDTPNFADPRFKTRVKQPAYAVREQSGLIWAYIGPKEQEPPFRRWAYDEVPDDQRVVLRVNVKANYLQLWEGGADSSHVGILHANLVRPGWMEARNKVDFSDVPTFADQAPEFEIEDTAFGFHYAAFRQAAEDPTKAYVRVQPLIMPTMRMIAGPTFTFTVWETPTDDVSTSTYLVMHSLVGKPLDKAMILKLLGLDDGRYWSEKDCEFRATWDDRFGQDRANMGRSWSGFSGIETEDVAVSLSYGPIFDRSTEHLVPADQAVVRLRQRLLHCVRLNEAGKPPLGLFIEDMTKVGCPSSNMNRGESWRSLVPGHAIHEAAE